MLIKSLLLLCKLLLILRCKLSTHTPGFSIIEGKGGLPPSVKK